MIRALLIALLLTAPAVAADITGRVDRVADGDTLTVAGTRVRICGIQAPEAGTSAGRASKAALETLVADNIVQCRPVGAGTPCDGRSKPTSYDRVVAQCFVDGRDLAAEQVRTGHAADWLRYSGGAYARP